MDITYYKRYEPMFGGWEIVREIGEGSCGRVFEIEREDSGHTYKSALKALTVPQGVGEDMVDVFSQMSKLNRHQNIVGYEDHAIAMREEGVGWDVLIRMELLTPLAEYVNNKPLDRAGTIKLGIDICTALVFCAKHNIVHGDIKPDSIFVSDDGRFKLGKFGMAKAMERIPGNGNNKRTYSYAAPEIYRGEAYDLRADIYSLGMMLYLYMNNGRLPFLPPAPERIRASDNDRAIRRRMDGKEIPAPVNADEDLARVILRACAYDPAERYSSPAEMREDLEAIAEGAAPVHAVPDAKAPDRQPDEPKSAPTQTPPKKKKNKTLIIAAVLILAIIAAVRIVAVHKWTDIVAVSAGDYHTVGLKSDGTVVATGENDDGQCDVSDWTDIIAIRAGGSHTVGLKSDGTVVATGDNQYHQCDVSGWTDIVAVAAGGNTTVGLKSDGTVVATGDESAGINLYDRQCDVSDWTGIVAVSVGDYNIVGLKSDGTVVVTGDNRFGQCDVSDWTDIVGVSTDYYHTVGLRSDGTVVATGDIEVGQCNVSDWTDIIGISTDRYHTVGLRSDGTVVATGDNEFGQCNVSDCADIVAVSAGRYHTVGLKSDGTVVATGLNNESQCVVCLKNIFGVWVWGKTMM